MQGQTFVFFGIVGSGKGTQIKLLMESLKQKDGKECVYAYPGNEYRRLMEENNETGILVKESVKGGHLQPNFLTNAIFIGLLIEGVSPDKHLIADGYPRTLEQADCFEKAMNFYKRSDIKIIYIKISHDEAMKRNLLRGRPDDTKDGIEQRFQEYMNNVVPSMNYFKDKQGYKVYEINGEQPVADVQKDIALALGL